MDKNRFNQRIIISPEILSKISRLDEFKGLWQGSTRMSPQTLGRLKRSVIITSTGASTRIEGALMSDQEVARLLSGLKTTLPKGRDAEEVAGYADLLGRIFDNWKSFKLSESLVLSFHKILLNFSKKDQEHLGKYKTKDNIVVARGDEGKQKIIFRPTQPYLVKKEMDDVLYWTNEELEKGELHSFLLIYNFIFEFLAIHPFIDGNGRLSRALSNLLILRAGYSYVPYVSLEEIIEEKKKDYYLALRATQKNHKTKKEDISPWLNFMLDVMIVQMEKAKALMQQDDPVKLLSGKHLEIYKLFNYSNELNSSLIFKLLKEKTPLISIKQALSHLLKLELIEKMGQGRGTRYKKIYEKTNNYNPRR
jgi:Fic family protein